MNEERKSGGPVFAGRPFLPEDGERLLSEAEIRADERRKLCAREGHDWHTVTNRGERARGIETEICGRCGATAVTTRVVTEPA